jgi:transcriptional regulator with XRE-family HTH domain
MLLAEKDLRVGPVCFTLCAVTSATDRLAWGVGDVVRKLRTQQGWTQSELAEAADVHKNTVVRLEDSDEGVKGATLKKIARALGMTPARLYALIPGSNELIGEDPSHAKQDRHATVGFRDKKRAR